MISKETMKSEHIKDVTPVRGADWCLDVYYWILNWAALGCCGALLGGPYVPTEGGAQTMI